LINQRHCLNSHVEIRTHCKQISWKNNKRNRHNKPRIGNNTRQHGHRIATPRAANQQLTLGRAPAVQSSFALPWPLSLLSANESQEKWQIYHNVFTACLQTGDNESAYLCLEELTERFGKENERVMALQGLYEEATAKNDAELQAVLERYEEILKEDPTLFAIQKRRAALLRSMGKTSEAVVALTALLDASPIDAESWAELADVYLTQGLFEQAIFSLEEVLLCTPNAWNIHARLGEVLFLAGNKAEGAEQLKLLSEAMRRFCRSIELCDDYLRGYYGLKLVSLPSCKHVNHAKWPSKY
jgi:tetratricopeptide (TPR) repeat protein